MSEEGNRDDATATLQYLTLRTNLISTLNQLKQEYFHMAKEISINRKHWDEEQVKKFLNHLADRRDYLLDISKQGLAPNDHAYFKDLVDSFDIGYWTKGFLEKKVTKKY